MEIKEQIENIGKEVKADVQRVEAEVKSLSEVKDKLQAQVDALEAKANRAGKGGEGEAKNAFVAAFEAKADALKNRQRGETVEIQLDKKAVVNMLTVTAAGLVQPQQLGLIQKPAALTHLRDVIAGGTTTSNSMTYVQEKGFEGAPAFTAEGALKSKVSLELENKTEPVRKLTAYFKASSELQADAPALMSYIQARVVDELREVENLQLAYGDGTGVNLKGFMPQATAFNMQNSTVGAAGPTMIDTLRLAITQVRKAKYTANAILMNPVDVATLILTKDANKNYLLPFVMTNGIPTIGGVRIIEQDIIEEGAFVVGAFDKAVQIFDREGMSIRVFDQNEDDAIKNMITVVIEERLVQVVYRPEAIVKGTFDSAIGIIQGV